MASFVNPIRANLIEATRTVLAQVGPFCMSGCPAAVLTWLQVRQATVSVELKD
jgi:hypothetical protein